MPGPRVNGTPVVGAVRCVVDEAVRCREAGVAQTILFNRCGPRHFDMQAYRGSFARGLTDESCDELELAMALARLPSAPAV